VCKRQKEREKERKNRNQIKFFIIIVLKKNELPPKKIKKNALLAGHRAGVPCCPVSRVRI
jgi:hypothetical protein